MIRTHTWATAAAILLFADVIVAQTPALTLAEARKALNAVEVAATKINVNTLSCVVVDSRGDLVLGMRMDGAKHFNMNLALGKALAAAAFRKPSGDPSMATFAARNIDGAFPGPQVLFMQGAVPIERNNQALGAIGCSGSNPQGEEDLVKLGVAAVQ